MREQGVTEVITVLALHAAVFLEPFDAVGVEHLTPHIGIVAGRVTANDVAEVGRAVTRGNGLEVHTGIGKDLRLVFHQRLSRRNFFDT